MYGQFRTNMRECAKRCECAYVYLVQTPLNMYMRSFRVNVRANVCECVNVRTNVRANVRKRVNVRAYISH